jgi:hypothetical protein
MATDAYKLREFGYLSQRTAAQKAKELESFSELDKNRVELPLLSMTIRVLIFQVCPEEKPELFGFVSESHKLLYQGSTKNIKFSCWRARCSGNVLEDQGFMEIGKELINLHHGHEILHTRASVTMPSNDQITFRDEYGRKCITGEFHNQAWQYKQLTGTLKHVILGNHAVLFSGASVPNEEYAKVCPTLGSFRYDSYGWGVCESTVRTLPSACVYNHGAFFGFAAVDDKLSITQLPTRQRNSKVCEQMIQPVQSDPSLLMSLRLTSLTEVIKFSRKQSLMELWPDDWLQQPCKKKRKRSDESDTGLAADGKKVYKQCLHELLSRLANEQLQESNNWTCQFPQFLDAV